MSTYLSSHFVDGKKNVVDCQFDRNRAFGYWLRFPRTWTWKLDDDDLRRWGNHKSIGRDRRLSIECVSMLLFLIFLSNSQHWFLYTRHILSVFFSTVRPLGNHRSDFDRATHSKPKWFVILKIKSKHTLSVINCCSIFSRRAVVAFFLRKRKDFAIKNRMYEMRPMSQTQIVVSSDGKMLRKLWSKCVVIA